MRLTIDVVGVPRPGGSKRGFPIRRKNGTIGVAMTDASGKPGKEWRESVRDAASQAVKAQDWSKALKPNGVLVEATFRLCRPASHYGSGKNADKLKPSAPLHHTQTPDATKLLRSTEDALKSVGIWEDDSQVVRASHGKDWVHRWETAGATIVITLA